MSAPTSAPPLKVAASPKKAPADAGLHYTILTSANAVAIGVGGMIGGIVADRAGLEAAFVAATLVCALPALLLPSWTDAARASAGECAKISRT